MDTVLSIKGLTKKHFNKTILDNIDLEIGYGQIIGLIGSNASGKTTLLNSISGMTRFNSGKVLVCGKPLCVDTKHQVSYHTSQHNFEKWMTIKDCIKVYHSSFHGFNAEKIEASLGIYGLDLKTRISELSIGKLEILAVLLTLSRKANLYLFDEPLAAVDVSVRDKIIELLLGHIDENCSIVIATHLLKDMGKIFDEVIMMHEGRILKQINVEDVKMSEGKTVEELFKEVFDDEDTYAVANI